MLKVKLNLRKVVVIAICLVCNMTMFAQDIIIMKNGNDIQVVVQEVGIDDVKYKRFDNQSGPNYVLKKSDIFMIRYKNGTKDVFNEMLTSTLTDKKQQLNQNELLSYSKGVWQNGIKLNSEQVIRVMSGNNEALQQYNKGRSLNIIGQVIAYPSAILFGCNMGIMIAGGEGNGMGLAVGAIGVLAGTIMEYSGKNKMKTSVLLYNSGINKTSSHQIDFGFTHTGLGLCMRF